MPQLKFAQLFFQANLGKTPLTYQKLTSLVAQIGPPPKPVDALDKLPKESQLSGNLNGIANKNTVTI